MAVDAVKVPGRDQTMTDTMDQRGCDHKMSER